MDRSKERFYERLGEVVKAGGGSNSVVESQPSKLLVAGSIPVSRSNLRSDVRRRLSTVARSAKVDDAGTG